MRSVTRIFTKILASLLVFILGFLTCIATIAGVAYFVYSKVTIDAINETGFVNIDTSNAINSDKAEVSLTSLTLSDLMGEYQELQNLGDEATINLLIKRYGLILSPELETVLNEEMREIPIFKLFSDEGVTMILKAQTVGSLLGYEKVKNENYTPTNGQKEFLWMDEGKEVIGVNGVLADYSLHRLLSDGVDTAGLSEELVIADLLNLSCVEDLEIYKLVNGNKVKVNDIEPIKVWYNDDGSRTDKVIASVAESTFADVGITFEGLQIADVIGYVEYNGEFYSWNISNDGTEHIMLTLEDGITSEFAGLTVKEVSEGGLDNEVSDIELYKVLGYTLGNDGKYYDDNNLEVKGIIAVLAGDKVGAIGESVGRVKVGEVAGYTYHEGKWYSVFSSTKPSDNIEAKGILASLSDLTVDEMTDEDKLSAKVQNIAVADVLGYEFDENTGNYTNNGSAVTGVMAVIAATPVNGIQEKLDTSDMGEIIGFDKRPVDVYGADGVTVVGQEDKWFDKDGNMVHVLMQKVGDTKFSEIGSLTDTLTLSDLIAEEERESGFISLVPEDTNINNIGTAVGEIFNDTSLSLFIDRGALEFENDGDAQRLIDLGYGSYTLPELFTVIIKNSVVAPPKTTTP